MQHAAEAALTYPLADALPAPGHALALHDGVHWLRMGLPFALDHINLWLLRDTLEGRAGWTVVDCGIDNAATRAHWEQLFAHGLQGLPVLRVVVTHMHPDHVGLAHWLTERWSTPGHPCRLWMSATDWSAARAACQADVGFSGDIAARFFARHGVHDAATLAHVRGRTDYYIRLVPRVPPTFVRLMHGMPLVIGGRTWRCIAGYGHAPEHMALHCAELDTLISGDMVLPRISTNVSVFAHEPLADPLPLYLDSIAALRELPAATLVLPSHGKPFTGLHERIDQLHQHHDERYDEVLQACAGRARSAAELVPVLFRRELDLHQLQFAMGEAIAHVHALAARGALEAVDDADGVRRWLSRL
jgi:glyoxylase-like metal-dependent hydrolase (beta-lactamase superfamily II)